MSRLRYSNGDTVPVKHGLPTWVIYSTIPQKFEQSRQLAGICAVLNCSEQIKESNLSPP